MGNPFKLSSIDSFLGRSKGVQFTPQIKPEIKKATENGNLEQRIASQYRELPPKYLDTATSGEITLNGGYGRSKFGAFPPYLA